MGPKSFSKSLSSMETAWLKFDFMHLLGIGGPDVAKPVHHKKVHILILAIKYMYDTIVLAEKHHRDQTSSNSRTRAVRRRQEVTVQLV